MDIRKIKMPTSKINLLEQKRNKNLLSNDETYELERLYKLKHEAGQILCYEVIDRDSRRRLRSILAEIDDGIYTYDIVINVHRAKWLEEIIDKKSEYDLITSHDQEELDKLLDFIQQKILMEDVITYVKQNPVGTTELVQELLTDYCPGNDMCDHCIYSKLCSLKKEN